WPGTCPTWLACGRSPPAEAHRIARFPSLSPRAAPNSFREGADAFPISVDVKSVSRRTLLGLRDGPARAQTIDILRAEPELRENLLVVLSQLRGASCRHLADAMHLNRAADRRGQLAAGAFERNDDVIRTQLRIVDDLLRPAHGAEGDVDAVEDLVPMSHRLRAEDVIENGRQLGHVLHQLGRIGEARVGQEIRTADGLGYWRQLVRRDDEHKPGVVGGAI